ncbi:MAG TPA: ABC transporter permease [Vicinamibacterales bacterium]|jgi:putative ABC transport system permease protein
MLSDLRQALRVLTKSPGFTALVVAVLAVGIGATTAIFSIVDGVLLKPLPFSEPSRILSIETLVRGEPDETSYPDLMDWRAAAKTLDRIGASTSMPATLTGRGEATVLEAAEVAGDFFETLDVPPAAGRTLTPNDDRAGAPNVALISAALWSSRFASDPAIVGTAVTLEGQPFTIVGVMPPAFNFPFSQDKVQIWLPMHSIPLAAKFAEQRGASMLHVIGRLGAGATLEQARAEMTTIVGRLAKAYPDTNGIRGGVRLRPLQEHLVQQYRLALLVLLAAVGAVLLIACANVANLLLARGIARHKEMAIRAALGAGRGRLVRQLLTESVLLSLVGGALGLLLALWGAAALVAASPLAIPRLNDVHVDRTVLLFAIIASTLTGMLFGLAPALHAARTNAGDTLKDAGRGTSGGRSARTRQLLVVVEVAMSLVLLVSAALLGRTLIALQHVDPGFVAEHAIGMQLSLQLKRYPKSPDHIAFYHRLADAARAIPGVASSAVSTTLPLTGSDVGIGFSIEGRPETADKTTRKSAAFFGISPDYFSAMGIRLLRGRGFTERDDEHAPAVIVIGESFAKRYWPNESPIGHRITIGYNDTGPREVVGVVADVKQGDLAEHAPLEMYTPFPQAPWPFLAVVVRAQGDPSTMAASLHRMLTAIDPEQPAAEVKTLNDYLARATATPRFTATLFGGFAAMALVLAAFGLFSVMAYSVAQRGREIGIRLALGAQPSAVRSLVLSQALWLGVTGLGIGVIGALAATRVLGALLFGVSASDPATFGAVSAALLLVMLAAAYLPARRATRVDPMIALRAD